MAETQAKTHTEDKEAETNTDGAETEATFETNSPDAARVNTHILLAPFRQKLTQLQSLGRREKPIFHKNSSLKTARLDGRIYIYIYDIVHIHIDKGLSITASL